MKFNEFFSEFQNSSKIFEKQKGNVTSLGCGWHEIFDELRKPLIKN